MQLINLVILCVYKPSQSATAVPGNLAVMVAVCLPELRTPRNILVSSLAFSDLLFSLSIPLTVMDAATLSWLLPPSLHLCRCPHNLSYKIRHFSAKG